MGELAPVPGSDGRIPRRVSSAGEVSSVTVLAGRPHAGNGTGNLLLVPWRGLRCGVSLAGGSFAWGRDTLAPVSVSTGACDRSRIGKRKHCGRYRHRARPVSARRAHRRGRNGRGVEGARRQPRPGRRHQDAPARRARRRDDARTLPPRGAGAVPALPPRRRHRLRLRRPGRLRLPGHGVRRPAARSSRASRPARCRSTTCSSSARRSPTRSTTRTATACFIAISSRATSC